MTKSKDIHLCSGVFLTKDPETPPIKIICQTLIIDGRSYAWIDGVDERRPVLLPSEHLNEFKRMGTLYDYLTNDIHESLAESLQEVMQLCTNQSQTPCTLVRAIELMHAEQLGPEQAIAQALAWGKLIQVMEFQNEAVQ